MNILLVMCLVICFLQHEFKNVAAFKASYVRSTEEWLSPINDSILKEAGLRIVSKEQIEIHCPYHSMLQKQSQNGGSGRLYVQIWYTNQYCIMCHKTI